MCCAADVGTTAFWAAKRLRLEIANPTNRAPIMLNPTPAATPMPMPRPSLLLSLLVLFDGERVTAPGGGAVGVLAARICRVVGSFTPASRGPGQRQMWIFLSFLSYSSSQLACKHRLGGRVAQEICVG